MSEWDLEIFNNVANPAPSWVSTVTPGFSVFDINESRVAVVHSNDTEQRVVILVYLGGTVPEIRSYAYIEDCCIPYKDDVDTLKPKVRRILVDLLWQSASSDYAAKITDELLDEVAQDVLESSDIHWSEDDVRLALGRVLIKRLGIEE